MKKISVFIVLMAWAIGLTAQETILEETLVEPPRFLLDVKGKNTSDKQNNTHRPAIYSFLQQRLDYPDDALSLREEGVVVVRFWVLPNGDLASFELQNPVFPSIDQRVLDCLEATSGHWMPGKVNGMPVAMLSKVYVKFDIEGNRSHKELAESHYLGALRNYRHAQKLSLDALLRPKKIESQYRKSLDKLALATKYCPEEPAVIVWQIMVYWQVGDSANYQSKQNEFNELVRDIPCDDDEMVCISAR